MLLLKSGMGQETQVIPLKKLRVMRAIASILMKKRVPRWGAPEMESITMVPKRLFWIPNWSFRVSKQQFRVPKQLF